VFQNQQLALNATVDFTLSEAVLSAIEHDIPILFKTEIVLFEKSDLFGFPIEKTQKKLNIIRNCMRME